VPKFFEKFCCRIAKRAHCWRGYPMPAYNKRAFVDRVEENSQRLERWRIRVVSSFT